MPKQRAQPKGPLARYLSERFRGLSLAQVAESTGLGVAQVSRHLSGSTEPRPRAVLHYAAALGEDPARLHELLGNEDLARLYRSVLGLDREKPACDPLLEHLFSRLRRLYDAGMTFKLDARLEEIEGVLEGLEKSFLRAMESVGAEAAFLATDVTSRSVLFALGIDEGEAGDILAQEPDSKWRRFETALDSPRLILCCRGWKDPVDHLQSTLDVWRDAFYQPLP